MAIWVWDKGPDPLVDFGRETYIPWRLSQGDVLYRDINHFNGPLSQYFNSVVFRVFGVSIAVLKITNALIIALATALVYHLVGQISDRVAATAAACLFLILSAFAYLVQSGNYSFLTPYSHELPHGITLALAAIACLDLWRKNARRRWCALSGLLLGLVFLTKAEIFLASASSLILGVVLVLWMRRVSARQGCSVMALFAGCAVAPILAAFLLLTLALPARDSAVALAGSWGFLGNKALMQLPYFKDMYGTADLPENLRSIALVSLGWSAAAAPALACGLLLRRRNRSEPLGDITVGAIVGILVAFVLWACQPLIDWQHIARPMPLAMLLAGVGICLRSRASRSDRSQASGIILPLTLILFAGAMLLKMLFNVRLVHYGFALAMPATMLVTAMSMGWLAAWVRARDGSGSATQAAIVVVLVYVAWVHLDMMNATFRAKVGRMAEGTADAFKVDEQGVVADHFVQTMKQISNSDQTLVMMPDGTMANYLARRVNPSTHLQFTPPAMIMYGEQRMLSDLRRSPPDFIGIINQDCGVYGARFLGVDFGKEIMSWVRQNYTPVRFFGASMDEPRVLGGITLLRRNAATGGHGD